MNIIVVDDDDAFRRSAELLLGDLGHAVRSFADPDSATAAFENNDCVDVLVIDYILPGATGLDFLRRVRARLSPACRVVLISGHTDHIEPLDLASLGIRAFLPKPLDYDALCAIVE